MGSAKARDELKATELSSPARLELAMRRKQEMAAFAVNLSQKN
jgi:hypothetical protein